MTDTLPSALATGSVGRCQGGLVGNKQLQGSQTQPYPCSPSGLQHSGWAETLTSKLVVVSLVCLFGFSSDFPHHGAPELHWG